MVCIPCFIVPLLLFIWHRFIQPYILRYWNPWGKKDAQGNLITTPENTKFPIDCTSGKCIFSGKAKSTSDKTEGGSENEKNDIPTTNPHEIVANKKDE